LREAAVEHGMEQPGGAEQPEENLNRTRRSKMIRCFM